MPDESCRNCGGIVITCSVCYKCNQPTQKVCVKCGILTMQQFHDICFYEIETIQTLSCIESMVS